MLPIGQQMKKWKWSHSVMSDSVRPHWRQPTKLPRPWDSPGKNTGVGSHAFLQRIFLIQESNLCLLCLLRWQEGFFLFFFFIPLVPPGKQELFLFLVWQIKASKGLWHQQWPGTFFKLDMFSYSLTPFIPCTFFYSVSVFLLNQCFLWLSFSFVWRRRWHTTLVLLPGKSHGWRSLVGCSPWGC